MLVTGSDVSLGCASVLHKTCILQTRLPTVSASRPSPFPQPHGTPARPPPCHVGPASALPPALRAAGPVSSENSAGCASPGRAEPSQRVQHWWGSQDPPAAPVAILSPGNLRWAAQSGCGTRPWADEGVYDAAVVGQGLASLRPALGTEN